MEKTTKLLYNIIYAVSKNNGIGKSGKLPWKLSLDMTHFKKITIGDYDESNTFNKLYSSLLTGNGKELLKNAFQENKFKSNKQNLVVMGRKTWESIPVKFRPFSERINIILSKCEKFKENNPNIDNKFYVVSNIDSFFTLASQLKEIEKVNEVFVIGGKQIYEEFLNNYPENCKYIFQTYLEKEIDCDTFFELPKDTFACINVSKSFVENKTTDTVFDFRIFLNKKVNNLNLNFENELKNYLTMYPQHEELQYLNAIRDIIDTGVTKTDRTGVGTISKFGYIMKYDCSETFPLLTTKDTFYRGIVEELLWFIKGDTNAKHLQEKKIHIWDGNSSREFLDKMGFSDREEGDLGPVYGFQWRHFGAKYVDMNTDYETQGVDQLTNVINELKTNPTSRRIILIAWNVLDINKMALPPCHCLVQFYVENDKLNLLMYQRSADMGLGVPFNIASYALLLRIVAQCCDLKPGTFVHSIGDAHVYKSHISALQKQLLRTPRPFPILKINPDKKLIDDFKYEDFTLLNYNPFPKIKMDMAV